MANLHSLHGKKIVFVFGNLELGGAERQGLLLAEYLQNHGQANVEVWGLRKEPGRLSKLCDEKGISWRGIKCGWGKFSLTRMAKLFRFSLVLRRGKPDIILSYTRLPNLICGLTWRLSGATSFIWNQRDEGLLLTGNFWDRLAVRLTPAFISNSVAGKVFLEETYGVPQRHVSVIHNGVEASLPKDSRSVWRERLGISPDCFVGCMVANVHPYKDHRTLLKAWGGLGQQFGECQPVLLLAGRVDSGRDELEVLATELGIRDRVIFLGKVDDVAGLLQSVDLCVHSSVSEGLPNAVLEAMAAGIPVVATDIPGIREAVGPEGTPFLAPVGDFDKLSALIADLIRDEDLRHKFGRSLLNRVRQNFSLNAMCRSALAVIVGTITEKAPRKGN